MSDIYDLENLLQSSMSQFAKFMCRNSEIASRSFANALTMVIKLLFVVFV